MHFFRFYFRKSPFRDREGNISHFRLHRKDIASIGEIRKIQNLSTNWVQRIWVENSKLVFKAFLWHLIPFQKNRQQHNQKWGQPRERIYLSTYGNCCVFQKTVAYHTHGLKYQRRWTLKWKFCQQRLNLLMVKRYFLKAKKLDNPSFPRDSRKWRNFRNFCLLFSLEAKELPRQ